MGTSITAGIYAPGAYLTPIIVGSRLNLTPVNVGFSATGVGGYQGPINDDFSLRKLVDAITSGDWGAQDRSIASMVGGNEAQLARIKTVDFRKVTHIGLEYGTNDFTVCAPLATFKEIAKLLRAKTSHLVSESAGVSNDASVAFYFWAVGQ
jgi:hypothetical protein